VRPCQALLLLLSAIVCTKNCNKNERKMENISSSLFIFFLLSIVYEYIKAMHAEEQGKE
jgi:hypothetical protein